MCNIFCLFNPMQAASMTIAQPVLNTPDFFVTAGCMEICRIVWVICSSSESPNMPIFPWRTTGPETRPAQFAYYSTTYARLVVLTSSSRAVRADCGPRVHKSPSFLHRFYVRIFCRASHLKLHCVSLSYSTLQASPATPV